MGVQAARQSFYFTSDKDKSLAEYVAGRGYFDAGQRPPVSTTDEVHQIQDLLNAHEQHERARRDNGETTIKTHQMRRRTCDLVAEYLPTDMLVTSLRPHHFESLRRQLSKRLSAVTLGHELSRIKAIFRFDFESELIPAMPNFGPAWRRPPKRLTRKAKSVRAARLFSAGEILSLIDSAKPDMRAMIWLGINAALGPADIG